MSHSLTDIVIAVAPSWTDVVIAVSTGIVALVALVTLLRARDPVRELIRGRRYQVLSDLRRTWDDEPMLEARKEVIRYETREGLLAAFRQADEEEFFILSRVPNFWEDVGSLVNSGVIEFEPVRNNFGNAITYYWGRFAPIVAFLRETRSQPSLYEWFEELADRIEA